MVRAKTGNHLAYITPKVLTWALNESGKTRKTIAAALKIQPEVLESWEKTRAYPQFDKAIELAEYLNIPFGYLFLSESPKRNIPIPDKRTLKPRYRPSANFKALLTDVLVRQDWYRQYAVEIGKTPLAFVGSASLNDEPRRVAESIRQSLGLGSEDRHRGIYAWGDYVTLLANKAESIGILVMRSGVVGNNSHRKIDRHEVQGFAISDPLAPVVFVNSADFDAARVFTIAHELVHIWVGRSAIANPNQGEDARDGVESFCNAVATELLVPRDEFIAAWKDTGPTSRVDVLVHHFWVSARVVLRRARELGELNHEEYMNLRDRAVAAEKKKKKKKDEQRNFFTVAAVRASHTITDAVISEVNKGRLQLVEAAQLLSMRPYTVADFAEGAKYS